MANMLSKLAQSMIVASCGPQMAAVVFDKGTDECFLVVLQPLSTTTAAVASLRARIEKLPHPPEVESIEPLNRRLQARLGWGDVGLAELTRPGLMDALYAEFLRDGLPHTEYWQHPNHRGGAFQVIDPPKPSDGEKLAWLRQELGGNADLLDFARKYLELFRSKVSMEAVQKASVLRLYRQYAGGGWAKESDLPPAILTEFQQIWNPDAPERCRECAKALVGAHPITHLFCSKGCERAGKVIACARCGSAEHLTESEWGYHCAACSVRAAPRARDPKRPRSKEPGDICARLDDQVRQLAMVSRLWDVSFTADPDHEPAWKRRRRA